MIITLIKKNHLKAINDLFPQQEAYGAKVNIFIDQSALEDDVANLKLYFSHGAIFTFTHIG